MKPADFNSIREDLLKEVSDLAALPYQSVGTQWMLNRKREQLKAWDAHEAELSELRQAIGLVTTLAPQMQMDAMNPLKMAREVVAYLHEFDAMRLAAISVGALTNTAQTISEQRITRGNPYWTVALQDVYDAVDREVGLRERLREAETKLDEKLAAANVVSRGGE